MFQSNLVRGMLCAALVPFVAGVGLQAQNVIKSSNGVTSIKLAPYKGSGDFTHAQPMPLPQANLTEDAVQIGRAHV